MPLRYVLDEQLRGPLWRAIESHNACGIDLIDAVRVGDKPDLPLGTSDPDILLWARREARILVTRDVNTMPTHLADHLQKGHHSPGIFAIRRRSLLPQVVFSLALYMHAGDASNLEDRIEYIP
jgi:hypothetical protein